MPTSSAFPLLTSHSQPGHSSKPIQEKPTEQCTLPVPDQRPEDPALSARTNKQGLWDQKAPDNPRTEDPRKGVPAWWRPWTWDRAL